MASDFDSVFGIKPEPAGIDDLFNADALGIDEVEAGEYPELSHALTGGFWGDMGMGLARTFLFDDDYAQLALQHSANKDAKLLRDTNGDWVLDTGGKGNPDDYRYINAPGFSSRDALQIGGLAAGGGAGGGAGRAVGSQVLGRVATQRLAQRAGTALGAGVAGGATNTAQQIAGDVALDRPLDQMLDTFEPGAVAQDTLLSAVGQKAFNKLLTPLMRTGRDGLSQLRGYFGYDGKLSKEGRIALESIGINPDAYTPEQIKNINRVITHYRQLPDDELGRALSLEAEGFRPTQGNITQKSADQLEENLLELGNHGPDAEAAMKSEVLKPRAQQVQRRMDEMFPEGDPSVVQRELDANLQQRRTQHDTAFQGIRDDAKQTLMPANKRDELEQAIRENITNKFSAWDADQILNDRVDPFPEGEDLREIVAWASRVNKKGAQGMEAVEALRSNLRTIDPDDELRAFAAEIDPDDLMGLNVPPNEATKYNALIDDWINEVGKYQEFKGEFGASDIVEKMVKRHKGGTGELTLPANEVADTLFGLTDRQLASKRGMAGAIMQIENILGRDSEGWQQLRQELGRRLIGGRNIREDSTDQIARFSGRTIRKNFEDALDKNPELLRSVFGDELDQMDNFTRTLALLTPDSAKGGKLNSTTPLGVNKSVVSRLVRGVLPETSFRLIPFLEAGLGMLESGAKRGAGGQTLRKAVNPIRTGAPNLPPWAGVIGAQNADHTRDVLQWLMDEGHEQGGNFIDWWNDTPEEEEEDQFMIPLLPSG